LKESTGRVPERGLPSTRAVGVRPLRGQYQGEERAEDAVLVQAGHGVGCAAIESVRPGRRRRDGAVAVGDVGIDGRVEPVSNSRTSAPTSGAWRASVVST
jgi:hypothetical protein